jgi:predicted nucleotidyltransferase
MNNFYAVVYRFFVSLKIMMKHCPYTVKDIKRRITPAAKKYGVGKVYLFGSYSRGDANANSDVDLCIEKGKIKTLLDLSGFKIDVENALCKKVDILTTTGIDKDFKHFIEKEMKIVYG